jgi:hypothetical protein
MVGRIGCQEIESFAICHIVGHVTQSFTAVCLTQQTLDLGFAALFTSPTQISILSHNPHQLD